MIKATAKTLIARLGYTIAPVSTALPDAFSEIERLCRTAVNPVIFDVGAHHGLVSLRYRDLLPGSTVYAFEPSPVSYERLKEHTAADPMIKPFNLGLADTTEVKPFSSNRLPATNSLLETDDRAASIWGQGLLETIERSDVPFKSLDDLVSEMHIPAIDILKMDVQGAEYLVMRGAEKAIADSRIGIIYTEILVAPTYSGQKPLDEVLRMFREYGFELHNIYNLDTKNGRLCQVDAIFISPSFAALTSPDGRGRPPGYRG
jgi:FkbM family methyltransferase